MLCHDPTVTDGAPAASTPGPSTVETAGRAIIRLDEAGTALFAVTAVIEAILLGRTSETIGIAVALGLFALGCLAFFAGYVTAIQRSRTDEISITNLYLLGSGTAARPVRNRLNLLLAAQIVVAATTAAARPFTTLAFGILTPMFGLGLNGLWAARHGRFPPRIPRSRPGRRRPGAAPTPASDPQVGDEIEQNASHG